MFRCSRSLFAPFAGLMAAVVLAAGCMSTPKPKEEIRLARTGGADDASLTANASLQGNVPGAGGWQPGMAPDDATLGLDSSMTRTPGSGFDPLAKSGVDETGSILNTASTAGVEKGVAGELDMIHFMYDAAEILPEWAAVLDRHVEWMKANPTKMVQVEGHCDERGTEEYNIALGQRRADAVRAYMVGKGIDANRISTISYGKMRPLTFDQDENSHMLNRRAMFLVYELDASLAAAQ
jgi:peptidoglycan-associated lipoprotein